MGILGPVILPTTCVVAPCNTKFVQRRAVGSELVGHDGGWSDALLLQEFSHQLERRLASGCPCRKSDLAVFVMQSAQNWPAQNAPGGLNSARYRRILVQ